MISLVSRSARAVAILAILPDSFCEARSRHSPRIMPVLTFMIFRTLLEQHSIQQLFSGLY